MPLAADKQANTTDQPIILLVDDEPDLLSAIKRSLHKISAKIVCCHSPATALAFTEHTQPDLVISDHRMPKMTGSELLAEIAEQWPQTQRVLLSAYNDFDTVANAFNQGIIHRYINKPWDNDELRFIVVKALEAAKTPIIPVKEQLKQHLNEKQTHFHGMIAEHSAMLTIFDEIRSAAATNVPVFITGETGTGKELIAKACHAESYRKDATFVAVNCANFNEQLMESQLFGHKKGAFTGATSSQEGLFSVCASGTLFLDEITTIPAQLQAKLLRVIQEREFCPLGSHTPQPFNAQLITASSTTLREAVNAGEFREDLYYRLNVITISLPPLRARGSDIILIANHFLTRFAKQEKKAFKRFNSEAEKLVGEFRWPGNIRQLENVIHSIVAMNNGEEVTAAMLLKPIKDDLNQIDIEQAKTQTTNNLNPNDLNLSHLSTTPRQTNGQTSNEHQPQQILPLWMVEKTAIENAIAFCDGNIPKAAVMLEINPSTIYRKLQSWKKE